MKQFSFLILFILSTLICFSSVPSGFKIKETVSGLPDSTWLYLDFTSPKQEKDSCLVINGKFNINGIVAEDACQVILHAANNTDYVFFWLENTEVDINLKAGEFRKATITGSATNNLAKELEVSTKSVNQSLDSLRRLIRVTADTSAKRILLSNLDIIDEQRQQKERDWVKSHPNSLIAAFLVDLYATTWGRKNTETLYKSLSDQMKASRYGRQILEYISVNKDIKVGDRYADFEQADTSGKIIKLSQVEGKFVLLDFWASWCGPCRKENPNLVKTYARFKEKGFAILGVSVDDDKNQWLSAIKYDQLSWQNVSDIRGTKNKAVLLYGVNRFPTNFLIDSNGIVIAKDLRGKQLDDKLNELLK